MIQCVICQREFKIITNSHLKKEHGITPEEYQERFNAPLLDEVMRSKITASRYHVEKPTCFKPGCDNIVTNSWNKYCSSRCSASHRLSKYGRNEQAGSNNPAYKDGWYSLGKDQKRKARERDSYKCRWCGDKVEGRQAHVHHVVPERCFDDPSKAHDLDNLVTLCDKCHLRFEWETIRELYDRALKLDKVLADNTEHVKFEEFKSKMLKL